ncbi:hypothetical protein ASD65_06055 [Microbacterium sp. Root61]|nr:hypothetical protein ASD65_06055 [Microbacterium sp. Root61]
MTDAVCLAPSELASALTESPELEDFPLYLVARRPRLSIVEVADDAGDLQVVIENPDGDAVTLIYEGFQGQFLLEDGGLFFEIHDTNDERLAEGRAGQLLTLDGSLVQLQRPQARAEAPIVDETLLDLEVLYVGKSNDDKGVTERRLLSHSKLQQILADHVDHAPGYELWVIPMQFGATNTVSVIHGQDSERELDAEAVWAGANPRFDRETLIALAEAATIRMFDPIYNKHYRASFPSLHHKTYSAVFPSEYNGLGVTMNTFDTIRCRLWSEARPADFLHETAWVIDPAKRKPLATVDDILGLFSARDPSDVG